MPYNLVLEELIDELLPEITPGKIKMFGGICYLINGNMGFGIWKDYLIVRMAPALAKDKLEDEFVGEFDLTGKPMKGWVMVEEGAWGNRDDLARWLDIGRSFALSLPKKQPKRKSLEEIYYRTRR
jgi:hypothetical protein